MATIRYNIANGKKINYSRFIVVSVVLIVLSAGLFTAGVMSFSSTSQRFREKKQELKTYEERLLAKNQKNNAQKKEIDNIKRKWRKERKFVNALIDNKVYSFLDKLDKLEKLLPAGVFISKLTLNAENGTRFQFNVAAISSAKLLEAYRAFLEYNLVIQKETQIGGLYRANLQIRLDR